MKYQQLLARRAALVQSMRDMSTKADAEGRPFSEEEVAKYGGFKSELAQVKTAIAREEELIALERETITQAAAGDESRGVTATDPNQRQADEQRWGSLGEFLQAVRTASVTGQVDRRLVAPAASTGMNEAIGSEGGFLVQTDYAATLLRRAYDNSVILPRVSRIPISANSNGVKINAVKESSRATGSRWGGVQVYWKEEGGAPTASKPTFRQIELYLKKLMGLCYATDELLADSVALEAVITTAFGEEFAFVIQDALYNGTGAGQPLGILNSPAKVSVTRNTSSDFKAADAQNMYARMWARSIPNSVWHINQDVWPKLFALADAAGNSIFLPGGTLSGSPFGTLLGRPILPIEQCQTLGTHGDAALVDWSQYLFADKGTMEAASSMHVQFTAAEMTYRFIYRCDGTPAWHAALTPYKGSNTQSPFIFLAT